MKQVCKACQQEKPETDFYMQARDGCRPRRMRVCKQCHKDRVTRNAKSRRQRTRTAIRRATA